MEDEQIEYYHTDGVALGGYDVVAYFTVNRAIHGNHKFACKWKNALWLFENQKHLDLFSQTPEKYAPMYGGYCAFGVANGYKATPKPQAFSVVDDKLYLNFADYVKVRWKQKQSNFILAANQQWEGIKSSTPIRAHRVLIWWKYQFLKLWGKDLFG